MARINFADVPEQKSFDPLPSGQYVAQISNVNLRQASDNAKNPGALNIRWEFEIVFNDEYNGRKVFDNHTCVESSMWKVKALLNALELDTSSLEYDDEDQKFYLDDDEVDMEDFVGQTVELKVGIRPAGIDAKSGREFERQNRVNGFYPHEASDEELMA